MEEVKYVLMRFWVSGLDTGSPRKPKNALGALLAKSSDGKEFAPLSEEEYTHVCEGLAKLHARDPSAYLAIHARYIDGIFDTAKASKSLRCGETAYKGNLRAGHSFLSAYLIA